MRKQFRDLASLDTARVRVLALAGEPTVTAASLSAAGGRTVAEAVRAPIDVPGFDRSIMDGYAVRAGDTAGAYDDDPVALAYAGAVSAGVPPEVVVEPGTAVEIATGAVVPQGADAVVKVERTRREGDAVLVERPVAPTENVMGAGADIPAGSAVVRQGDRLDPRRVGLLAAVGVDEVSVFERPRVGIVSTGREIVRPTDRDALEPAEIFDTNSFALSSAVEDAGGVPEIYPHAGEADDDIRGTLERAADERDIVLSTGSTSASAEDVVYRVIEEAGELVLHGVALKPGKPTVVGRLGDTPVLGLPGNPISALLTFRVFAAPLIRREAGLRAESNDPTTRARLATTVDSVEGRTQLLPVGLVESPRDGRLTYSVNKGSGAITSLGDADGYVTVPDSVHYLEAGADVEVTLLGRDVTPPDVLAGGATCHVFDRLLDEVDPRVRWLAAGAVDGATRLREGIMDVALVDLPDEALDDLGLRGADRVRGYDRTEGLAMAESPSEASGSALLERIGTVAALPEGTGSRWYLERAAPDRELEVRDRPSHRGIATAVAEGTVDAGVLPQHEAVERGLAFVALRTASMDLLVAHDRREKPGVRTLLEAIEGLDLTDTVGYESASNPGATLTSW